MALNVAMAISANASQARAELTALRGDIKDLGPVTERSAQATRVLEAAASAAAVDIRAEAQAAAVAEAQNQRLTRSSQQAAGAVGNMTAQFNDIFMMVAAGQNPMQVAIQQGTQITQGFGPGGAAGALRLLGAGFMSMLSPINLVTIAGIAAGAAFIQWLTDAGVEAVTLDDAIVDLEQSVSDLREAGSQSLKDLRDRFGVITPEVIALRKEIFDMRIEDAFDKASAAAAALKAELAGGLAGSIQPIADLLNRPAGVGGRGGFRVDPSVGAFQGDVDALIASENVQQQIDAVERLQAAIRAAKDEQEGFTVAQRTALANLLEIETQLRLALAAEEQKTGAQAEANRQLQEEIAALNTKAQIDALIVQYGEDSVQVATARVQAERDALMATLEASDASESVKTAYLAAWDAAQGIASVDMAGNIALAANEAGRLAGYMERAASIRAIAAANVADRVGDTDRGGQREQRRSAAEFNSQRIMEQLRENYSAGNGGGGGAAAARDEADAIERLIERKQQELELLRVSDPVQREMIRNRELLADATAEQRAQIEEVTAALEREKAMQEATDFFGSAAGDFLTSIVTGSQSAGDALDDLIAKLIEAGIQALLLGEGPLAGLFGTAGTSIFGALFGGGGGGTGAFGLPLPFAEGGMIYGAGGPTDDKMLIAASAGEFVVNGQATARNRALLEFLNAGGELPRFATGGAVGGGGGGGSFGSTSNGPLVEMPITIDARGAQKGVAEEVKAVFASYMPQFEKIAVAAVAKASKRGMRA